MAKYFFLSLLIASSAFAKVTLNKPLECGTVLDISSSVTNGKETATATMFCQMDPNDRTSHEEVTVELQSQNQVTILTSIHAGNRPIFKGDSLIPLVTISKSSSGKLIATKVNISTYSQ